MKKKNLSRRKFVSWAAAGTGSLFLGNAIACGHTSPFQDNSDPLKIISLGNTGIKTTLLGMGTGYNGYNHSSSITRAGVAETVIRAAYDKGIRFFDCADAYGTHPHTARALREIPRENYTINTKILLSSGARQESESPDANKVIDRFRKELDTDYIDIVQIHLMTSGTWTDQHKRQMDIMETLKVKGIIRAHGVSIHSLAAMEAAAASSWVDVVHVRINPFGASMDTERPENVTPIIERLHQSGKGVIAMKVFGNGSFSNDSKKLDQSLKYVLGLSCVDMIIIGFENPGQIDNCKQRMIRALQA